MQDSVNTGACVTQYGYWQIASLGTIEILNSTRNRPKKMTAPELNAPTGNGSASTSNANLPVWGLTYGHS